MLKHINKEHEGVEESVEFSFEVFRKQKNPLEGQISGAVNISKK